MLVKEPVLRTHLKLASDEKCDIATLIEDPKAQRIVLEHLQRHAQQQELAKIEILEGVVISPLTEWTPQNVSALLGVKDTTSWLILI